MTRRQRTTFFYIAVAIFCIASPILVWYAAGYRIDLASQKIVKTGGLSLTAGPPPVNIFVDGSLLSSNNFLFWNVFTPNLLPGDYTVEAAKDGYYSWQKVLTIYEGQVTEIYNIILYPKKPRTAKIADRIDSFFASPDGAHILLIQNQNGGEILSSKQGTADPVIIKNLTKDELIQQVIWTQDGTSFLLFEKIRGASRLALGSTLSQPFTLQDLSSFIPAAAIPDGALGSVQFSQDVKLLYLLSSPTAAKQGIYIFHLDTHLLEGPMQKNVSGFLSAADGVYTLGSTTGTVSRCSADLSSCAQMTTAQSALSGIGLSVFSTDGDHLALLRDKKLYLYLPEQKTFTHITDEVQTISFALDKQKIAIQKDNEVSVYWLKDIPRGDTHKTGDMNLLLRISEEVNGVSWLAQPYQYLAVSSSDALRIIELDGRDTRNIVSYPEFSSPKNIFWQKDQNDLLLIHGQILLQDFLYNLAT